MDKLVQAFADVLETLPPEVLEEMLSLWEGEEDSVLEGVDAMGGDWDGDWLMIVS